ncbi:hypothetical protein NDU88_005318 [Pleurodeles waltl]|uniref:Uncharacterized protein n=1 Tax=Pleurodeles waltl TaxID=8319 RepID=A0AAV7L0W2_PLEWA|nr:hypothetical protein NDU88_005318 [Pleurodeles waltl]
MYYRDKAAEHLTADDRTCTTETKLQNASQQATEHVLQRQSDIMYYRDRVTEHVLQRQSDIMCYRDKAAEYIAAGDRTCTTETKLQNT